MLITYHHVFNIINHPMATDIQILNSSFCSSAIALTNVSIHHPWSISCHPRSFSMAESSSAMRPTEIIVGMRPRDATISFYSCSETLKTPYWGLFHPRRCMAVRPVQAVAIVNQGEGHI